MVKKIIGIGILVATILLIVFMVKSKKRPNFTQPQKSTELKLLIESIIPSKENIIITANGNVAAKWQTEIKSEVNGPIISISDQLLAGAEFKKGQTLLIIDATNYESEVSRQKANLAIAEEKYLEEKIRSQRALDDWKSLNSKQEANDYTLRKPQLKSAKMNLEAAKMDLLTAQNNLSKTVIKAPYDGYVISRFVDLGEIIQVGNKIVEVFSSQDLELSIPLKNRQIEMILSSRNQAIKVYDVASVNDHWIAQVSRVDQLIDSQSRWRNLYLNINQQDNPGKKLPIKGSFLQSQISLDLDQEFLKIDEKSLSMQGYIWTVDENSLLKKSKPNLAFRNNGSIYINPETKYKYPLKLVSIPSSTLLEGIKVSQQELVNEIAYE